MKIEIKLLKTVYLIGKNMYSWNYRTIVVSHHIKLKIPDTHFQLQLLQLIVILDIEFALIIMKFLSAKPRCAIAIVIHDRIHKNVKLTSESGSF